MNACGRKTSRKIGRCPRFCLFSPSAPVSFRACFRLLAAGFASGNKPKNASEKSSERYAIVGKIARKFARPPHARRCFPRSVAFALSVLCALRPELASRFDIDGSRTKREVLRLITLPKQKTASRVFFRSLIPDHHPEETKRGKSPLPSPQGERRTGENKKMPRHSRSR